MFAALPAIASIGGGLLGGIMGKGKADEAKRVAKMNAQLGALDTRFSPFVQGNSVKQAVPDAGPGMFAGALSGGLGGLKAGMGVQKMLAQGNVYDILKKKAELDPNVLNAQLGQSPRMLA